VQCRSIVVVELEVGRAKLEKEVYILRLYLYTFRMRQLAFVYMRRKGITGTLILVCSVYIGDRGVEILIKMLE
jgi:hypothetical protein